MMERYFNAYQNSFDKYNFEFLSGEFLNSEKFINNVLSFFFPELDEKEYGKYKNSITDISKLISETGYEEKLKYHLLDFFISPMQAISRLSYCLQTSFIQIKALYEKGYKKIAEIYNTIDMLQLVWQTEFFHGIKTNENPAVFISLLHKNCFQVFRTGTQNIILLGTDYTEYIKYLNNRSNAPDISVFGKIFSEPSRVRILDYLAVDNRELTVKEICINFDITHTTTHYHVDMMTKAKFLNTRNKGRTIYYSLNKSYFSRLVDYIIRYSEYTEVK